MKINLSIKLGSTAIGITTPEGVVLAVEKRITSSLIIPSSIEKIVEIDSHLGIFTDFKINQKFLIILFKKNSLCYEWSDCGR